ncbi:MAG: beta-lactamase family protein [Candidatus Aminicenantes bacterium]|nr:beta-lactamase family protein [Candidatus Aminicenantes bacterium]MDH5385027.1 beta-lactamase family protein [Candidatus Aminicenantes bacterium]
MKNHLTIAKIGGIFFLIAILSIISLADDKTNQVDKLFDIWDTTISPGASLAIIHNGEIIYKRGYGMANLEQNIPITPETVFRIGSTSKQFTAACIGILVSQSKISLDDDIRKYVPELPQYEKPITVRHLIHHTSGLRDYLELEYLAGKSEDDFFTPEDTVAILSRQKGLNFVPGNEYLYSNSGYFLLGVIVSRVSGKSLNEFAQEQIFKPLGMNNTHFHDDYTMIVKGRADGHAQTKGGFKINNTTLNHVGDGGVFTTVEDLYLWDQTFYNEMLGKELMELMHQTGSLNNGEKLEYAFGLRLSNYKGLKTVAHGGAWVGFRAEMIRFPEEKFTVICLANLASINPSQLCRQITDIYLADKFTAMESPEKAAEEIKPVALTKEELDNKTGMFIATKGLTVVEFSVEGDKLVIETRGEKFRLIPVSRSKFVTKDAPGDITVEFWPPDREAQNAKVTIEGEGEINLKKTPKIAPLTTEELKAYSGFYYNDELPATYKLVAEDDKLVFKHRNAPEKPLKMIDKDKFLSEYGKLEFKRGKREKITGFYLDAGRVRIQFEKI